MIIANQQQVTPAVLAAIAQTPDPRFREIMSALVRHLHDFAREVKLTEREFERAVGYVVALGRHTTDSHNEAVLMSGSLGFSTLICLLNNGNNGRTETAANLLGPFWRMNSPRTQNGGSIVRSPTPGPALFVNARAVDGAGRPVAGAEVDVWHSSPEGFYEQQDPKQADMNLRGKFTTDAAGSFGFRSVKPAGYPIPIDGPVGEFVRATRRHHYRPAHLHFLIYKPGFKTLISQVYVNDDERLDTDVQFGVTRALIGNYVRHDEPAPAPDVKGPWYSLDYTFALEPGEARLPKPPIK
ncbi:MAG TPA: dioxygenase [Xanthobacteraceae bacterium]|nr:dioxygenase [Xanthobacteraceae bacterium]